MSDNTDTTPTRVTSIAVGKELTQEDVDAMMAMLAVFGEFSVKIQALSRALTIAFGELDAQTRELVGVMDETEEE